MKRRLGLLVLLMAACTLALVGLQVYWNYAAYQQATRTFERDAHEALVEAAQQEVAQRLQAFRQQYGRWLADTNQVVIRSSDQPRDGITIFSLSDRHPVGRERRQPFNLGFKGYVRPAGLPDTTGRAYFIQRFLAGALTTDLREGITYFYTVRLAGKQEAAYAADTVHQRRLARLYRRALRARGISTSFRLQLGPSKAPAGSLGYVTAPTDMGLPRTSRLVRAWLPNPHRVYLTRMKWVLLGSVGLVALVAGCFGYTLRTVLNQERLAELKNDFVNNMTHELKTPVATIGITAEALASFELAPADQAEYLGIIRQQTSRLGSLIDKILQSVVAEQSGLALAFRPLDLSAVLAQAIAHAQPRLAEAGTCVQYEAPPAPVPIKGDAMHLLNVLATLLDNALKYGRPGGAIALDCRALNGAATVGLRNEGPTIPPQYQARIFEKFFRVPTGNRHDVPGYGLGLHYARTLIERHGGTISVQSYGGRTTFTITLPLAHVPAPPVVVGR